MAEITGKIGQRKIINGTVDKAKTVYENDYELLKNLPSIKGVVLIGEISLEDLGLAADGITIVSDGGFLRVKDDSHGHIIGNITGLQLVLDEKAKASDLLTLGNNLETHIADKENPHGTTAEQIGLGNVENKSSADILGELTKDYITALGIPAQDTTYGAVTESANGLATPAMLTKLNGIASGANNYVHPAYTANSSGLYKITVDATGHISAVTAVTKADITALGIPAQDTNTTYGVATSSANGLMLAADKKKLDGIAEGVTVETITSKIRRNSNVRDHFRTI